MCFYFQMLGVCISDTDIIQYKILFCSLVGKDNISWGLFYIGNFYYNGKVYNYILRFDQGLVIGVYLDIWYGNLFFFKDNELFGVVVKGFIGKILYFVVLLIVVRIKMKF